jgi:uncharacterized membrane protein
MNYDDTFKYRARVIALNLLLVAGTVLLVLRPRESGRGVLIKAKAFLLVSAYSLFHLKESKLMKGVSVWKNRSR